MPSSSSRYTPPPPLSSVLHGTTPLQRASLRRRGAGNLYVLSQHQSPRRGRGHSVTRTTLPPEATAGVVCPVE
ncbi:hypothetical protein E2C01_026317 [Portunus trituberculatus]|uniref:Uncharacterized protein n=1 Tax=Portunus trituberculatus TaxID=210409 RepID=A0A5B7EII6_PORTR|nr:hypothetical protein [Portunus trituberculatus]